jgi:2,3-dihydroxybenzoate decarboxylase
MASGDRFPDMQMAKNRTIRDYFATNMHITSAYLP